MRHIPWCPSGSFPLLCRTMVSFWFVSVLMPDSELKFLLTISCSSRNVSRALQRYLLRVGMFGCTLHDSFRKAFSMSLFELSRVRTKATSYLAANSRNIFTSARFAMSVSEGMSRNSENKSNSHTTNKSVGLELPHQ